MKELRLGIVDFWKGMDENDFFITRLLAEDFHLELTTDDPEFVICGGFGKSFLDYSCPRIFFSGEAIAPDFNMYDYAIGFDPINYGDRYIQYPLCYADEQCIEKVKNKHRRTDDELKQKEKFCAFVVSAGAGYGNVRDRIYDSVNAYKTVDSGGRYRNNLPDGKPVADKMDFLEKYRFSLALENTVYPGYVTEKIMEAWASGTIPIYYGDKACVEMFNPGSFLWLPSLVELPKLMENLQRLDSDEKEYLKMQHCPVFREDSVWHPENKKKELRQFLLHIFEQRSVEAYRRSSKRSMIGVFYENNQNNWRKIEYSGAYRFLRNTKRKYFGLKKFEW